MRSWGSRASHWDTSVGDSCNHPVQPGAIRRDEDGYWIVDLEWTREAGERQPEIPSSMVAGLGDTKVLLTDIMQSETRPGPEIQTINVIRLSFATVVTGPDISTVESAGIVEAGVLFPNQMEWASYLRPDWRYRHNDDPLGEGCSLDFPTYSESNLAIGRGMRLAVRGTWLGGYDLEQLHIPSGPTLKLSAKTPTPTAEFIKTFLSLQDLISICWDGRVAPTPGAGRVNAAQEKLGLFYSRYLAEPYPAPLAKLHNAPIVTLEHLGGPRAFVRWLALGRYFERATRGVSEGLYVGSSVEVRLLNIMAATEYWVGRHKHSPLWKKANRSGAKNPAPSTHQVSTSDVQALGWRWSTVQRSPLVGLSRAQA